MQTLTEKIKTDALLILKGNGPYLSLVDIRTYEEIAKRQVLKYRVIHKLIKSSHDPGLICVMGQKAFNLVKLNKNLEFEILLENLVEMEDWIFEINWQEVDEVIYLIIVCAHNQCIIYNLNTKSIEKTVYCTQKCMLYPFCLN